MVLYETLQKKLRIPEDSSTQAFNYSKPPMKHPNSISNSKINKLTYSVEMLQDILSIETIKHLVTWHPKHKDR